MGQVAAQSRREPSLMTCEATRKKPSPFLPKWEYRKQRQAWEQSSGSGHERSFPHHIQGKQGTPPIQQGVNQAGRSTA